MEVKIEKMKIGTVCSYMSVVYNRKAVGGVIYCKNRCDYYVGINERKKHVLCKYRSKIQNANTLKFKPEYLKGERCCIGSHTGRYEGYGLNVEEIEKQMPSIDHLPTIDPGEEERARLKMDRLLGKTNPL